MTSLVRGLVALGLLAAIAWLTAETFRLAEQLGRAEVATRELEGRLGATVADRDEVAAVRDEVAAARDVAVAETARLQQELVLATGQLSTMAERVEAATVEARRRVEAAREAELRALQAMPEGVRQCLAALHESLRIEGFAGLRFLRAMALDEDGLHGVEVVHTSADGLTVEILVASVMRAVLDRTERRLVLTFVDGTRTAGGERVALPEKGWEVVVAPVDGRIFEERLPYLVRAVGAYPEAADEGAGATLPTDVDRPTRLAWLERLDRLLEAAGTTERIRVRRFRGIDTGAFLDAQLIATDDKGHVQFGAGCARLAVEVDRTAGVVSLLLRDGTLRRGEATSTITEVGTRILLPDVTPAQAIETMLGLVVDR